MAKVNVEQFSKEDAEKYVDGIATHVIPALEAKSDALGKAEMIDPEALKKFIENLDKDGFDAVGTMVSLASVGIL